jgi:hypothetical protein
MRKSRQPRCTAAIAKIAALKASKLLDADWNFSQAIFRATSLGAAPLAVKLPRWHQVEQAVPGA